jgi:hypothetical protein
VNRVNRQYVYLAVWGEFVKVGTSQDPARRVRDLIWPAVAPPRPAGRPELVGYVDGGVGAEHLLHVALAPYAVGREWFWLTPEVEAVLDAVRSARTGNLRGPLWYQPVKREPISDDF